MTHDLSDDFNANTGAIAVVKAFDQLLVSLSKFTISEGLSDVSWWPLEMAHFVADCFVDCHPSMTIQSLIEGIDFATAGFINRVNKGEAI